MRVAFILIAIALCTTALPAKKVSVGKNSGKNKGMKPFIQLLPIFLSGLASRSSNQQNQLSQEAADVGQNEIKIDEVIDDAELKKLFEMAQETSEEEIKNSLEALERDDPFLKSHQKRAFWASLFKVFKKLLPTVISSLSSN